MLLFGNYSLNVERKMSNFDIAFDLLIKNEGYYSNDPDDKGGETKFGISKRSYPELDISKLTLEQAKEIYKRDFWDNLGLDRINNFSVGVAVKLFDMAVNIGCKWAVKILQRAIRSLTLNRIILNEDGLLGAETLSAANLGLGDSNNREDLLCLDVAIRSELAGYYRSLNNDKYINGWLNRAYS